jgi:polysaccharide pyruvyl transferase WcaK-like protein
VSHHPAATAKRYGVEAVAAPFFASGAKTASERRAALDALLATAAEGQRNPFVDEVARADAVVLSGGGNLSSVWPDLFYERVALLLLARMLGKPAIVLGQTIGPEIAPEESMLLADALSDVRFVGVRELPSLALALALGVAPDRLWYQTDDALFLDPTPAPATGPAGLPAIAVTIEPQIRAAGEALFGALVRQLRELARTTGARLVLIPHVFGNEAAEPSDLAEARLLAERLELPESAVAAGIGAAEARRITGEAALVVSSRYHPIVFAMSAGVPSIAIYNDEYSRIKAEGALAHAHAGLVPWALPYDGIHRGELLTAALELWRVRGEVRAQLEARRVTWRDEHRRRWAAILRALQEAAPRPADAGTLFGHPAREMALLLAATVEAKRRAWRREQVAFLRLTERCEQAEGFVRWATARRTFRGYASAVFRRLGLPKIFRRQRSQRLES